MLSIENLTFGFGEQPVLRDVQLRCETGRIHGILGLNGAGKTTFFRILYGFYKIKQGEIRWNEQVIQRSDVAFLETENYFYPYTKGLEYVQLVTECKIETAKIEQWNELFELPLNDFIETYSTGMRKKLAFLACLLQNRQLMILDEPFNGIDLESSERLFLILQKLRDNGKTIVLSSHILSSLTTVCDKIHHLEKGNFVKTYNKIEFDALAKNIQQGISEKVELQMKYLM